MKNMRICIMDGKEYEYCPSCHKYDNLPRWMMSFCSDNCHDIFAVFCEYRQNKISKADAAEKLKVLVSDASALSANFKKTYDEIMTEDKPPVEAAPKKRSKVKKKPDSELN